MRSTLVRGAVVALAAVLVVLASHLLGMPNPWPMLLAAGIALARPFDVGTVVATLVGAAAWWVGLALRVTLLPDTTSARVVAAVVAVLVVTAMAAASRDRLPLWAGLVGIGLFAALYEPIFAEQPTRFLTDSTLALASTVVAVAVGTLAAVLGEIAARTRLKAPVPVRGPRPGEVAS